MNDETPTSTLASDIELVELIPPRHPVDPRSRNWWAWQAVIAAVIALAIEGLLFIWLWSVLPTPLSLTIIVISVVCTASYIIVMPRVRYQIHRWETTDEAVYARSGWIWQEWRVAPLSRIQTVDIERGPLQRMFNLSTMIVTTASSAGAIKIEGLDHDEAQRLVQHLTTITQATPGDAT